MYDGYSLLDPTGPAEVLSRLPGATVTMIAERRGPVRTDTGDVTVTADRSITEVDRLDVLLVPGGGNRGTVAAMENQAPLDWIRGIDRHSRWTTSVCTGTLVLAAGPARRTPGDDVLGLRRLPGVGVRCDLCAGALRAFGRDPHGGGGLDGPGHGPVLASLIAGETTAKAIRLAVGYDPRPPFDSGNAADADPQLNGPALRLLAESQV